MDVFLGLLSCRDLLLPAQGAAEITASLLLPLYSYVCPQPLLPQDHRLCVWAGLENTTVCRGVIMCFISKQNLKQNELKTARPGGPSPLPLPKAGCLLLPLPIFCWLSASPAGTKWG